MGDDLDCFWRNLLGLQERWERMRGRFVSFMERIHLQRRNTVFFVQIGGDGENNGFSDRCKIN
jgi:hypothetical protein